MCKPSEAPAPVRPKKQEAVPSFLSSSTTLVLGGIIGYLLAFFLHRGGNGSPNTDHFDGSLSIGCEDASTNITSLQHTVVDSVASHGEEGSADDEEEEEGEEGAVLFTTVTIIVCFLIVLTIAFEKVKESIEEAADKAMKPVLEGLFGEMTVLGFLSTVTFCITKLGWFSKLSSYIFGTEEDGELLEIFETTHFLLFFVMIFFVVSVLVLLKGGEATEKTWWNFNRASQDADFMSYLEKIKPPTEARQRSYWKFLFLQVFPFVSSKQQLRSDLSLFHTLRHEFLLERDLDPPFAPAVDCLKHDFDFGRYLSVCLGNELGHVVHLQTSTWLLLAFVTLCLYVFGLLFENTLETFAWVWVASGWLCFLLGSFFDFHMVQLLEGMAATHVPNINISDTSESTEGDPLLGKRASGSSFYCDGSEKSSTNSLLGNRNSQSLGLPKWTRINLNSHLHKGRSWLSQIFLPKKMNITRQDCLYWMERKGPKLYMILFQVQMVWTAAYTSLLLLTMFPYMFKESPQSNIKQLLYLLLSLIPIYLLLSKYQRAAANLAVACSIGVHRRPQVIAQVIREEKTSQVIRAMVSMQNLHRAVARGFTGNQNRNQQIADPSRSIMDKSTSSVELDESLHIFSTLDADSDGTLEVSELDQILRKLGAPVTQENLAKMIELLDDDGNGVITPDEFHWFYRTYVKVELDDEGLRQLAKDMFKQLDSAGNGVLSPCEFKDILCAFNVGFSMDEIGELIDELDENGDGEICEHEFLRLLETHRLLFEKVPLPELE